MRYRKVILFCGCVLLMVVAFKSHFFSLLTNGRRNVSAESLLDDRFADLPGVKSASIPLLDPAATESEKWVWWDKMLKMDPHFMYRVPIVFFGKVVDDLGQPVEDAHVRAEWSNVNGGDSREMKTDQSGLFTLDGVVGKKLGIEVRKDGYEVYLKRNRFIFEYGSFSDSSYHVPDKNNPVRFVLHKKREAEPLWVSKKQEAKLLPGDSREFRVGPNEVMLLVERLKGLPAGEWAIRASIVGGGLSVAAQEFPVEAPETGYVPVIEITKYTPNSSMSRGEVGAVLFVKTEHGYGRVNLKCPSGNDWVYVTSYFNPNPSSRNLEFDRNKVINH